MKIMMVYTSGPHSLIFMPENEDEELWLAKTKDKFSYFMLMPPAPVSTFGPGTPGGSNKNSTGIEYMLKKIGPKNHDN